MSVYPGQGRWPYPYAPPLVAQPAPVANQPMPGGGHPGAAGWGTSPSDYLTSVDPLFVKHLKEAAEESMKVLSGGQPGAAGWGRGPVNCPPGLEYLTSVDQLLIKQKVMILKVFTGFETNNKYEVLNSMGQRVYMAVEDTCCCTRCCCGSSRPFHIKLMDIRKRELIHLNRPLRCECCICFCCLQKMEVQAPPGSVIGYVRQAWSCCIPKYKINNENDETMLRVEGPCCPYNICHICGDLEFEVSSADGETHVGTISKQWSGLAKEIFTDADNFGVTFPQDMDVKTKATMLGAVFLIDFMYFEEGTKDKKKKADHMD